MPLDTLPTLIDTWLDEIDARPVYVGYSGGLDSTALLHLLRDRLSPEQVIAIHVNHRLNDRADDWQRHCAAVCAALDCALVTRTVKVTGDGRGLEAAARDERYRVFDAEVPSGAALWLAHHLDDQLETFIQRLLRGSGLGGLSAMNSRHRRGHYQVIRPLLEQPRRALEAWVRAQGLRWIEDSSNADPSHDRNYLRHTVMPLLEARWPHYRQTLNRSLQHLSRAHSELEAGLHRELDHRLSHDGALKAVQLDDWSDERIQSLIHLWLRQQGVQPPSTDRMRRILDEVVRAQPDAQPSVDVGAGSVRRFRTALYWVPRQEPPGEPPRCRTDTWLDWPGVGRIRFEPASQGPNRLRLPAAPLRLALRAGGETLWPAGRPAARDLKRLLQEYRLPPWRRDRLPLLYAGDRLVAVADLCIDRDWLAEEDEPGLRIHFEGAP